MESVSDDGTVAIIHRVRREQLLWTGRPGQVPPGADRQTGVVVLLVVPAVTAFFVMTVLIGHGTPWTTRAGQGLLLLGGAANIVRAACRLVWTLPAARRLEALGPEPRQRGDQVHGVR